LKSIDIQSIVEGCLNKDPKCQRILYERYARPMLGICLRYTNDRMEAEDVLQLGFVKIFRAMDTFKGGAFEGWMKRIFIRESINQYHSKKRKIIDYMEDNIYLNTQTSDGFSDALSNLGVQEILGLLEKLPEGSKLVFNLFAIEGYTHAEIGELLDISEGTSKSQYSRARQLLKHQLTHFEI